MKQAKSTTFKDIITAIFGTKKKMQMNNLIKLVLQMKSRSNSFRKIWNRSENQEKLVRNIKAKSCKSNFKRRSCQRITKYWKSVRKSKIGKRLHNRLNSGTLLDWLCRRIKKTQCIWDVNSRFSPMSISCITVEFNEYYNWKNVVPNKFETRMLINFEFLKRWTTLWI